MLYTFGHKGGEMEHKPIRIGKKMILEGFVFSTPEPRRWLINAKQRYEVMVPDGDTCPARKNDMFYCEVELVEEDPDVWCTTHPPMVKISLEEDDIFQMMKKAFRCSEARMNELTFHIKRNAQTDRKRLQEFIDEFIGIYIRVPSENLLTLHFPKVKKDGILRFFKDWNEMMKRRLKLLGITHDMAKEFKRPPSEIYEILLKNPLRAPEISMETAKMVLRRLNKPLTPLDEKCGKMLRFIYSELQSGNMYISYTWLFQNFQVSPDEFYYLEENYGIKGDRNTGRVYYQNASNSNQDLAKILYTKLKGACPQRAVDLSIVDTRLTDMQKFALVGALSLPLTIVTGKGGSGKSTLIGEIFKQEPKIALLSYTGKAVSRLAEITQSKVPSTIHKCIANLEMEEDVRHVVIDEATMADTELVLQFLKTYPYPRFNFRITLVGDPNQLPPISWGSFFERLIETQKIPTFHLQQVMRIDKGIENDGIMLNCNQLLAHVEETRRYGMTRPFRFEITPNFQFRKGSAKDAVSILIGRKNMGLPIDDTVILSPYKDSVAELNELCVQEFCKGQRSISDSVGKKWFVGMPVCNRINNYHVNIMNGERGHIHDIEKGNLIVKLNDQFYPFSIQVKSTFLGQNYFYEGKNLKEEEFCNTGTLNYDYATTVHSAQGSEWKNVIIYIPMGRKANYSSFLDYRLIYTMLSRAKSKVWIIGDIDALFISAVQINKAKHDDFGEKFLACE